MKKTTVARLINGICARMKYHITEYDKLTAEPFYAKHKELSNA